MIKNGEHMPYYKYIRVLKQAPNTISALPPRQVENQRKHKWLWLTYESISEQILHRGQEAWRQPNNRSTRGRAGGVTQPTEPRRLILENATLKQIDDYHTNLNFGSDLGATASSIRQGRPSVTVDMLFFDSNLAHLILSFM